MLNIKIAEEENNTEMLPWLLFKLGSKQYAISSEAVTSIVLAPKKIEPLPGVRKEMLGIFVLRGQVVPLLGMRELLDMPKLTEEFDEFVHTLEARKQDHLNWSAEFETAVTMRKPFKLSDNPHECKFGQWYYSYKPTSRAINFHMKKIEEPHEALHKLAQTYNSCLSNNKLDNVDELAALARDEYVPEIVELIDDAKDVFLGSYREMVIVLEYCGRTLGLLVDSVSSIKNLVAAPGGKEILSNDASTSYYLEDVAQTENSDDLILKLNYEKLLECLGC